MVKFRDISKGEYPNDQDFPIQCMELSSIFSVNSEPPKIIKSMDTWDYWVSTNYDYFFSSDYPLWIPISELDECLNTKSPVSGIKSESLDISKFVSERTKFQGERFLLDGSSVREYTFDPNGDLGMYFRCSWSIQVPQILVSNQKEAENLVQRLIEDMKTKGSLR